MTILLKGFRVNSPLLLGGTMSEMEVFGAATWLWMHSKNHCHHHLYELEHLLTPIVQYQQYLLVCDSTRPICFFSWAYLDEASERRYLTKPRATLRKEDWRSGNRIWAIDFISPFGHTLQMASFIRKYLFAENCFRSIYHNSHTRGKQVVNFWGYQQPKESVRKWHQNTPLTVPLKELPSLNTR